MIFILNASDFVKLIQEISVNAIDNTKPMSILFGEVISSEPIKIFIEQKLILNSNYLIIPEHLRDFDTKISFDNPDIKQIFTTYNIDETNESNPSKISFKDKVEHNITIYNALKTGDNVILIRCCGGQKYLVFDRF